MKKLPIRLRLTLVFALAMAAVLTAMGLFVYLRLGSALDESLDTGLRTRADDVAALIQEADSGLRENERSPLAEQGESFAQVLDGSGRIIDTTPQLGGRPLLSPTELSRAFAGTITLERERLPGVSGPARLLATPVAAQDTRLVVVVGSSLEARTEALSQLLAQLLIGGPLALLAASLLAYLLASAALRPVESMRREAEAISATEPGRRLPVPPARDEVARLGATLNDMLARLESALARERNFVADASHELRTPLTLLKTELELALLRPRSPAELEQALRSAAEETDRLSQLAEDLLVLTRADQGQLPIRRAPVLARDVLEGVRQRFARRAAAAGRPLMVDAPADLAAAADRLRLEQALGNLVENALRHGRGAVSLAAQAHDDHIELHVLDNGPGFPASFLEHAFERFTRGKESRAGGGAGLGLAIAAVIARAHGGSARAANRSEGGADVWLSLPTTGGQGRGRPSGYTHTRGGVAESGLLHRS